jgi:hypothetical protein
MTSSLSRIRVRSTPGLRDPVLSLCYWIKAPFDTWTGKSPARLPSNQLRCCRPYSRCVCCIALIEDSRLAILEHDYSVYWSFGRLALRAVYVESVQCTLTCKSVERVPAYGHDRSRESAPVKKRATACPVAAAVLQRCQRFGARCPTAQPSGLTGRVAVQAHRKQRCTRPRFPL